MATTVFVMILIAICLYRRRRQIPYLIRYIATAIKAVRDAWENM